MLKSKSDTTMLFVHMIIVRATSLEDFYIYLADVCLTAPVSHVIASLGLLYRHHIFRTIFDIKFSLQLLECLITTRYNIFVFCIYVLAM